ncbi:MAG: AMP-binding protein [Deltaproteobacteria bacterium]|nr:AMP-binding protein [Deltaproteobacteria bacterium]
MEPLPLSGTLPQILISQAERYGSRLTAIREKAYGIWQSYTWQDYGRYVRKAAMGFKNIGLHRGEHVGMITGNHPEWLFSELGAQAAGGITLNLFTSSVSDEISNTLNRIRASYVVAQDQEQVDKLIEARGRLSHVRKVVYIDPTGMRNYENDAWLMSYRDFLSQGEALDTENSELFLRELKRGRSDDVAVMITTSGTTGIPKLAMLTHRNFISIGKSWLNAIEITPGENWISMSPPAWIVDQMWGFGVALISGMTMNFPETEETVIEDFREIGPSVIITASRFWEDLASKIRVKMSDSGYIKRKVFDYAEKVGRVLLQYETERKGIPLYLRILHQSFSLMLYGPLLDRIGCSGFRGAYTGGHPISPDVIRFFRAIGLNLKQCYGLTEAGGIFQVQPDREVKPETVGKSLPQVEVKIASDQEVLVKSEANFAGYYQDFAATEAAFSDGWLRTGDAGYFDGDGHIVIIGRKEEIIRNKDGAAFSPDFIETRLKFSPFIKEAVVFGEGRPFITALINIDMGNVGNWAEDRMIPYTTYTDLSQQQAVEDLIFQEVRTVNTQIPEEMRIKKFILLYKLLDADDEELTRTGKVRRRFVYGLYLKLIEAMYSNLESLNVTGKVRYRDGQIGEIETRVQIISAA